MNRWVISMKVDSHSPSVLFSPGFRRGGVYAVGNSVLEIFSIAFQVKLVALVLRGMDLTINEATPTVSL